MLAVVPSQIVSYIDSRFPQVATGKGFYLGRDYAPILSHLLKLIDSLPSGVVTLEGDAFAEFGEGVEAVRAAVHAWNNGDNNHRLEKIPGRKTGIYATNINPL